MSETKALSWWKQPGLDARARQLASFVHRLSMEGNHREGADLLAATTALLVLERARGHSCLDPAQWAGKRPPVEGAAEALPSIETWSKELDRSSLVGDGEAPTPLVRDVAGRVALYRDHRAEKRLATRLLELASAPPAPPDAGTIALFGQLFPDAQPHGQALAAAAALCGRFTLVTGGPGTGKTTTVVRILALMLARDPRLRVRLAAPTGKAAARLTESIADQRDSLGLTEELRERLPDQVTTVHRLLGYRPSSESFTYDRENPLPADLVVVDEASMIDLLVMDALVESLAPGARLILLGDKDQLASVDAGYVLGDIVDAAGKVGGSSAAFSEATRDLFELPVATKPLPPLADAVVELTRNWRFESQPGISELARAIREGDGEAVLAVLEDPDRPDVGWEDLPRHTRELLRPLDALLDGLEHESGATELLRRQSEVRVLAALRRGRHGVEGLNEAVEQILRGRGWSFAGMHYAGRPLLITQNQPDLRLANGDVGVVVSVPSEGVDPSPSDSLVAAFESPGGDPRFIALPRLPAHESAWALTVHKSQGSEYDHVILVLPPRPHPLVTRELLYTAVTRARVSVRLVAPVETLRRGVATVGRRHSGLRDRLCADGMSEQGRFRQ